ncbi:hypothetical protein, partial [Eubacterium pyruvativorans]|uniref:hypothetical protein n=1 Tax=Eubacterium pyruvativorans TaxID=155865 RepID=UPI0023F4CD8D
QSRCENERKTRLIYAAPAVGCGLKIICDSAPETAGRMAEKYLDSIALVRPHRARKARPPDGVDEHPTDRIKIRAPKK